MLTMKGSRLFSRSLATSSTPPQKSLKNPYEYSVNLPETQFPMRANAVQNEQKYRLQCTDMLYEWQAKNRANAKIFTLHDGPPYANGPLHIGHALNKILKDITNRYKLLKGYQIKFVPGWDCHGLPIELKAVEGLKKLNKSATRGEMQRMDIRQKARQVASAAVNAQMQDFKEWGIMADWDGHYKTMDLDYELRQLKLFFEMSHKSLIYRKHRPVYWSPSSQTALAEAELEYNENHISRSVFCALKLKASTMFGLEDTHALIWTTTPWTLPANRAIAAGPEIEYDLYKSAELNKSYLIASNMSGSLETLFPDTSFDLVKTVQGSKLDGLEYELPLNGDIGKICTADYVLDNSGTGLVHIAPGHGFEDYDVGLKHGLDLSCPVDYRGRYTDEAGVRLSGQNILKEGTDCVIELLKERKQLVLEKPHVHKYPYDWRTKKPVIVRSTKQWFADVSKIQDQVQGCVAETEFYPEAGRRRLQSCIGSRKEWCISRQRSWGVPIPIIYDVEKDEPIVDVAVEEMILKVLSEMGTDFWWSSIDVKDFLPSDFPEGNYRKGSDTLDVWFDSGSSWTSLENGPADLYLEGSDQHRGWFQSSILTSVAVNGHAPYKKIVTHGFVLDKNNRKMSKSLKNVLNPTYVTRDGKDPGSKTGNLALGVDALRSWAASVDYTGDVVVGTDQLKQVGESLRKLRNTCRFMLSNTHSMAPHMMLPYNSLFGYDRAVLSSVAKFIKSCEASYETMAYPNVYTETKNFCANLSADYLETVKDRLYNNAIDSPSRLSAQTTLVHMLDALMLANAPIVPHLMEELFIHVKQIRPVGDKFSVFQQVWTPDHYKEWENMNAESEWKSLKELRQTVNVAIEKSRAEGLFKGTLECHVELQVPTSGDIFDIVKKYEQDLSEIFCSASCKVNFTNNDVPLKATAVKATHHKCGRCWKHIALVPDNVCTRCSQVLSTFKT